MRRTIGAMASVFVALVALAGVAAAQEGTGTGSGATAVAGSDITPDPGQTITVSGSGCPAHSPVDFFFDDQPAGGTTADADGNFSGPVTVPSGASSGKHTVTAKCGTLVMGFEISVNPPAVAAAAIPRTGTSSTIPLASVALALLAVGGLFVLFARRRRVTHQPA